MVVLEAQPIQRAAQVGAVQVSKQASAALLGVGRVHKNGVVVGVHHAVALLPERVCTGVNVFLVVTCSRWDLYLLSMTRCQGSNLLRCSPAHQGGLRSVEKAAEWERHSSVPQW